MQALLRRVKEQPGLPLLLLLTALGVGLFALSFLLPKEETPQRSEDLAYASSDLEQRLSAVLSTIEGVGRVRVLIHTGEEDGRIIGALVVAEGAQELSVRTSLMRAAMTALDVPAANVEVFAMQTEQGGEGN